MFGQTLRRRLSRYSPSLNPTNYLYNNLGCYCVRYDTHFLVDSTINSSKNSNRNSSSSSSSYSTTTNTTTRQVIQQLMEQGRTTQYRYYYSSSKINTNTNIQSYEYNTNFNNNYYKYNHQSMHGKYFSSASKSNDTTKTKTNTTISSTTTKSTRSISDNDKKADDAKHEPKLDANNNDDTTTTTGTTNNIKKGEEIYQQYITILEKIEQMKEDKERIKSEKMFTAWQRVTEKSSSRVQKEQQEQQEQQQMDLATTTTSTESESTTNTTTQQQTSTKTDNNNTRKTNSRINNKTNNKNLGIIVTKTLAKVTKDEIEQKDNETKIIEKLTQQANTLLQTAALQYNHSKALIILGNEQIQLASQQEQKQVKVQHEQQQENSYNNSPTANEYIQKGFEYYKNSQSAEGLYNLAHTLWTGIPSNNFSSVNENVVITTDDNNEWIMKPNKQEAMKVFVQAATQYNDCDAMYFLGVELLSTDNNNDDNEDNNNNSNDDTNNNVQENEKEETNIIQRRQEGLQWVKKAIELSNHGGAMYYLTLLYLNGDTQLNIKPCTDNEFQRLLEYSINSTTAVADAYYLRGYCYNTGQHGYTIHYENALNDYITCANMGHADGAVNAGVILFNGNYSSNNKYGPILPKNLQRAFEFYQLGGELGSIDGWRNVVSCYMNGHGVPQSIDMAKYIAKTMLSSE